MRVLREDLGKKYVIMGWSTSFDIWRAHINSL